MAVRLVRPAAGLIALLARINDLIVDEFLDFWLVENLGDGQSSLPSPCWDKMLKVTHIASSSLNQPCALKLGVNLKFLWVGSRIMG